MSALALAIYLGGIGAFPSKKIGFWRRALWPFALGERIAEQVLQEVQHEQDSTV